MLDCYILNTGFFVDKKITKEVTLSCIEAVVEGTAQFKKWNNFSDLEIMEVEGFVPDMTDTNITVFWKQDLKTELNL